MNIAISKDDRRNLEGVIAILAASIDLKTAVDCDTLAAIIQRVPDHLDEGLAALLSNAEHAVSDLYSDPRCERAGDTDNIEHAVECIIRAIEYRAAEAA